MPEVDLLLFLAHAGVFVGFGALIAVRSEGPREAHGVAPVLAEGARGLGWSAVRAGEEA